MAQYLAIGDDTQGSGNGCFSTGGSFQDAMLCMVVPELVKTYVQ